MTIPVARVLSPADWREREAAHVRRARRYADPYLGRRSTGRKHPVEDFLFTYYTQKPGQLLRWHPGDGVVLCGTAAAARRIGSTTGRSTAANSPGGPAARQHRSGVRQASAFLSERREAVQFARIILAGTAARPAQFGCFGLHEWAMVYRQEKFELRHEYLSCGWAARARTRWLRITGSAAPISTRSGSTHLTLCPLTA